MKGGRVKSTIQAALVIIAAVCTTTSSIAQELQAESLQRVERAIGLAMEGKPLAGVKELESASHDDRTVQSVIATLRVFAGDSTGALRSMEKTYPPQKENKVPFPIAVEPLNAIDAIVNEANKHRIVIINEAHHVSQHRAFISQLLPRLRDLGFKYYAAEALDEDGQLLKKRGYPNRQTGFYTNDHVFGDVIRKALALGLTPVAYEASNENASNVDPIDDINTREHEQCKNLVDRLFSKDANAKAIIHVGFDHAMEKPKIEGGREIRWLASRLAHATGENPLTIDQTEHSERGLGKESAQWAHAQKEGWLDKPIVLKHEDCTFDVSGHFNGMVDMQVFHPPTKYVDGRPDWLIHTGRSTFSFPDELRSIAERVLVEAFAEGEGDDAVPFDRLILEPNQPCPKLLLVPGKYSIVSQDEKGIEIKRVQAELKPNTTKSDSPN